MSKKLPDSFGGRLSKSIKDNGYTQENFPEYFRDTDGNYKYPYETLKKWCGMKTLPAKWEKLSEICDILNVDMDYLFGRIDNKTHDAKFICEYTGLSEQAVEELHKQKMQPENKRNKFNQIIEECYQKEHDDKKKKIREEAYSRKIKEANQQSFEWAFTISRVIETPGIIESIMSYLKRGNSIRNIHLEYDGFQLEEHPELEEGENYCVPFGNTDDYQTPYFIGWAEEDNIFIHNSEGNCTLSVNGMVFNEQIVKQALMHELQESLDKIQVQTKDNFNELYEGVVLDKEFETMLKSRMY